MKNRAAIVAACLAFAVPFGGVGVWASWAIVTNVMDGLRARDWVLVRAEVTGRTQFRYTIDGTTYTSDRIGSSRMGGTDNIDDWHERMAAIFAEAQKKRQPITVYVNPDNPAEAMADRTIRWSFLAFLSPFAIAFGAVGLGAMWFLSRALRAPQNQSGRVVEQTMASATGGVGAIWFFAIVWNAISIPIAALAVPEMIAREEWVGLLVLLFPLIGMLLLWSAIRMTVGRLRVGRPEFHLATSSPRAGGPLEGSVTFTRGVKPGEIVWVRLVCMKTSRRGNTTTTSASSATTSGWRNALQVKAVASGEVVRVPFRFDLPGNLPPTSSDENANPRHAWKIEVTPARNAGMPFEYPVTLLPALFVEAPAEELPPAAIAPEAITPAAAASVDRLVAGTAFAGRLTEQQRAVIARLDPKQREVVAKVLAWVPRSPRLVAYVIGGLIVAFEVVPSIYSFVQSLIANP